MCNKELNGLLWKRTMGPFMVGVPKKEKRLKDSLELLFINNIYMKQTN
jgi:hypothetical protein